MQNEDGNNVDLYIPRKCSWTSRLLTSKDHGTVQINVAHVDPVTGRHTGESTPFALSGYVRFRSEGDMALTELVKRNDAAMMNPSAAAAVGAAGVTQGTDGDVAVASAVGEE